MRCRSDSPRDPTKDRDRPVSFEVNRLIVVRKIAESTPLQDRSQAPLEIDFAHSTSSPSARNAKLPRPATDFAGLT
jgi:hypothetical protein